VRYRLYVDEVGNSDTKVSKNPNQRYLSLTALAFNMDYIADVVFPGLEKMKRDYFGHHPDTPIILHRKELMKKNFPFHALRDPAVEASFNKRFLGFVRDFDYMALTVVIDKWEHVEKYQNWHRDPYHYCLEVLLERFARWLEKRGAVGDVMAESRTPKDDRRLKAEYTKIWEYGTNFVRWTQIQEHLTTRQLKLENKRSNIAGLQFADLLAHPSYKAMLCHREHKKLAENFGGQIATILEAAKYDRSPSGRVSGWGRKWLP
jgi:hypothetical protein